MMDKFARISVVQTETWILIGWHKNVYLNEITTKIQSPGFTHLARRRKRTKFDLQRLAVCSLYLYLQNFKGTVSQEFSFN